jgi:starch synthase
MIFYCKGVIETVRKLGWAPDIIHCQGWFASLVPMYIKKLYADDPLFENVKVIYSVFDRSFDGVLSDTLPAKLLYERLEEADVARIQESNINNLHKFAVDYADAIVQASPEMDKDVLAHIKSSEKPFMEYPGDEDYIDAYQDFYSQFIEEEEVVTTED